MDPARIDRLENPVRFLGGVQVAMGLLALATLPIYCASFDLMQFFVAALEKSAGGYHLFHLSSHLICLLVMLPATFCAGMTLPLMTYLLLGVAPGERAIGAVYAANTVGAIVGVLLGGPRAHAERSAPRVWSRSAPSPTSDWASPCSPRCGPPAGARSSPGSRWYRWP